MTELLTKQQKILDQMMETVRKNQQSTLYKPRNMGKIYFRKALSEATKKESLWKKKQKN